MRLSPAFSGKVPHKQRLRPNLPGGLPPRAILPAHMHLAKRPLPKHARARLIAWALAMSIWLIAAITGAVALRPRHARQRADISAITRLLRLVKRLIISRAADFAHVRRRRRYCAVYRGRPVVPSGLVRALIGSRLRHALKRKDVIEQLRALIGALKNLDEYAVRLAKRMRRRLTRLAPIIAAPSAAAPLPPRGHAQVSAVNSS